MKSSICQNKKKMNTQASAGKLFITHTPNKGLISRIYREFPLINRRRKLNEKERILIDSYKTRHLNGQYANEKMLNTIIN